MQKFNLFFDYMVDNEVFFASVIIIELKGLSVFLRFSLLLAFDNLR